MVKKQRIGVVGWLFHFDNEYAATTAACDTIQPKLKDFCDKHPGVAPYGDYRKMADEAKIDAVLISTPNWLHREMAEYFLARGIHVFLEKPMGVNREEIDAVLAAQRKSGKTCAIDFELRVSLGFRRIAEIARSGEIGELRGVEFIHHRGGWLASGNGVWRTDPQRSGGLYFMEVCHEIDFVRMLMGEITHVQSFSHPNLLPQYPPDMPDNVVTHLWFEKGRRGTIITSHTSSVWNAPVDKYDDLGHDMYWVVTGTEGCLRVNDIHERILVCRYADHHPDAPVGRRVELVRVENYAGLEPGRFAHDIKTNHQEFLKSCALGTPFHQDTLDAWKTHVVCLAAERSAVTDNGKIAVSFD